MNSTIKQLAVLGSILIITGCASNKYTVIPPKDELALQDMQTRDFQASQKIAFASVLSVLQDVGYIVNAADGESGLITANSPSTTGTSYNLLWGFGQKNNQTKVTAFVEPIGTEVSKIRLNFVTSTTNSSAYGSTSSVDKPIEDPDIYNMVFEKISETIFVRESLTE